MQCSAPTFDVNIDPSGFVIDLASLYAYLARVQDRRHARGLRYALVTILGYIVLAKLAGEDRLFGISQWVRYRQSALAEALPVEKSRTPCVNTYRTILGQVIEIEEFERVVRECFAAQPQAGQSIVIALDGKTLRGTISAGHTQGRHLLAAYLPAEGWGSFRSKSLAKKMKSVPLHAYSKALICAAKLSRAMRCLRNGNCHCKL